MNTALKTLAIVCMVVVLFAAATFAFVAVSVSTDPDVQESINAIEEMSDEMNAPPVVTLAEFNKVQQRMTYQQVVGIIGSEGVVSWESSFENFDGSVLTMRTYTWENGDFSNANVSFENGVVTSKMQIGLK